MKSIEINTTQNVKIDYELAKPSERIVAFIIDGLVLSALSFVLSYFLLSVLGTSSFGTMFVVSLPLLYFFLYHFLMESLNGGQSVGKMAMGIKVVRLDGRAPTWGDAFIRSICHWVDTFFTVGMLGITLISTHENSQRYGDIASNTTVVRLARHTKLVSLKDLLSIVSRDTHKVTYPQVTKLSEEDMMDIHSLVLRLEKHRNQAHFDALEDLVTHLTQVLELPQRPADKLSFIKSLLKDYVALTR